MFGIPLPNLVLWGVVGFVALALVVFLSIVEGRHFRRQGAHAGWLRLRLASLPIAALALAAVYGSVKASGISGMESLAVAYLALFSLGPLVYFGLHALVGRMCGLRRGQSAWIAFSGLMLIGVLPALGGMLQTYVHLGARAWQEARITGAPAAPTPFAGTVRRFRLTDGEEVWAIGYHAAAGITYGRVDVEYAGYRATDVLRTTMATICRHGQELHLLWPTGRPLPVMHVFWQDAGQQGRQSSWQVIAEGGDAMPFEPVWHDDTVELPAMVPSEALSLLWPQPDGRIHADGLQRTSAETACAARRLELPARYGAGPARGLRLRIDHPAPKEATWVEFRHPQAPATASKAP